MLGPFWLPVCPGYSFLTEFYPGIPFCSLIGFLPEQILDPSLCSKFSLISQNTVGYFHLYGMVMGLYYVMIDMSLALGTNAII
jgi:hypothetical protein